jgi:hypothetical protein
MIYFRHTFHWSVARQTHTFDIPFFPSTRTGFYPKNKTYECLDPKAVALCYFKGWFLVDFVASFPYGLLFSHSNEASVETDSSTIAVSNAGKLVKVVKLVKLVRLIKLPIFMDLLDNNFKVSKAGVQITFLVIGIISVTHWSACLFFIISTSTLDAGDEKLPRWMPEV